MLTKCVLTEGFRHWWCLHDSFNLELVRGPCDPGRLWDPSDPHLGLYSLTQYPKCHQSLHSNPHDLTPFAPKDTTGQRGQDPWPRSQTQETEASGLKPKAPTFAAPAVSSSCHLGSQTTLKHRLSPTTQLGDPKGSHRWHQVVENPQGSPLYEKIRKPVRQSSGSFCSFFFIPPPKGLVT